MKRPTSYSSTTPTPPCICSARRLLISAEQHQVLKDGGLVRERPRTGHGRLHVKEHLRHHGMLADRLSHLDALGAVLRGLLECRGRHADALDANAEARLVHKREDLLPAVTRFPERCGERSLEQKGAGR